MYYTLSYSFKKYYSTVHDEFSKYWKTSVATEECTSGLAILEV